MDLNIEYFFNGFHGMFIYCESVNQDILAYGEDELLNLLRNYTINSRPNENLESQLDKMDQWCNVMPQIGQNNIDRNQNNKKFLRLIMLMYYRLLQKIPKTTCNIRNFIIQLNNDEKESIYVKAEKDLEHK